MVKFALVFGSACLLLAVQAIPQQSYDSWGSSESYSGLSREKRGGYIEQSRTGGYGRGASAGAGRLRGPAAGGVRKTAGYGAGPGYAAAPGPSSLYSYAPRRANAAVYGGIHGPQTSEEALKFDSHLTRSMIADALASRNLYQGHGGIISAAIQSRRNIQFYDVPSSGEAAEPITVEVGASPSALLNIRFKSASSPLQVDQDHESAPGSVRETSSEDEPHRLVHTVTRPIFQEVHEVIKPFRKITQEIQPIQEDIQTIVAKGDDIATGGAAIGGISGTVVDGGDGGAVISAGPVGGAVAGISAIGKPAFSTIGAAAGPSYSSGYTKPIGGSYGAGYGGSSGFGGGQVAQVQIPFARRAAAAGARRARA